MLKEFYLQLSKENRKFVFWVSILIFLTAIPSIFLLLSDFKFGIGWMLGSIGSFINFIWMVVSTASAIYQGESRAKLGAIKGFYFRFMFLVVYSILIIVIIKPDILGFGIGLISAQFCIVLFELVRSVKKSRFNKYF